MSNTINPDTVPVSQLEDTRLQGLERFSRGIGNRFHRRFLSNMYGALMTVLDEEGRILFFAAGALRRKLNNTQDEVVYMGLSEILAGLMGEGADGAYQPDYQSLVLEGPDRRMDWPLNFEEIPFLTTYLGRQIPEARSWGILRVGPVPDKMFDGWRPNCCNSEMYLDSSTWKEMSALGPIPGSGGYDLRERLAPSAKEYAAGIPSAWALAITAGSLFGGMSDVPKDVTPIKSSRLLGRVMDDELAQRAAKKKALAVARAARRAAESGSTGGGEFRDLRNAIDPDALSAIGDKIARASE